MLGVLDSWCPSRRLERADNGSSGLSLVDQMHALLIRCGSDDWDITSGEFWCRRDFGGLSVSETGWKLNLSATPLSAPALLANAGPVLVKSGYRRFTK
jgi:hypothetical protein